MKRISENSPAPEIPKAAFSVDDLIVAYGLSRQSIYNEINAGRLRVMKVGRRTLISAEAREDWCRALEENTSVKPELVRGANAARRKSAA
jgi:hypothetical protein